MRFACVFPILVLLVLQRADVGRINGRVVDSATNDFLPAVTVILMREGVSLMRATTDAEGRFSIQDIVPGPYRLVTSKEGYAPARPMGRQVHGLGLPLTVSAGNGLTGLTIPLDRAGVINGTILDQAGSPVFHAEVAALDTYFDEFGQKALGAREDSVARTDDRGQFRIYRLTAGQYYVRIIGPSDIFRPPGYMFYYSSGTAGPTNVVVNGGSETTLGTIQAPQAKFVPTRLKIITDVPVPAGTQRRLQFGLKDMPLMILSSSEPRIVGGPDMINISGLPVGINEIQAAWNSTEGLVSGHTTVEIRPTDNEVLGDIRMSRGVTVVVRGSVTDVNGVKRPVPNIRVSLRAIPTSPAANSMYQFDGQSADDGRVTWKSVPQRDYWITVGELPENTYITEFKGEAGDVLDGKIAIDRDSQIEIVVKDNGGTVLGRVKDTNGKPAHGSLVAFVPSDKTLRNRFWLSAGTVSDQEGQFVFRGVTPGRYKIFAWANAPGPGPFRNSEFLARYEEAGTSFEVGLGEHREIHIQLADESQ